MLGQTGFVALESWFERSSDWYLRSSEANDPHDIDSNCLRVLLCIGLSFNVNLLLLLLWYIILSFSIRMQRMVFVSPHDRNIRHKNSKYSLALHSGRRGRRRTPCCRILSHRRRDSPPDTKSSTSTMKFSQIHLCRIQTKFDKRNKTIFRCLSSVRSMSLIGGRKWTVAVENAMSDW